MSLKNSSIPPFSRLKESEEIYEELQSNNITNGMKRNRISKSSGLWFTRKKKC